MMVPASKRIKWHGQAAAFTHDIRLLQVQCLEQQVTGHTVGPLESLANHFVQVVETIQEPAGSHDRKQALSLTQTGSKIGLLNLKAYRVKGKLDMNYWISLRVELNEVTKIANLDTEVKTFHFMIKIRFLLHYQSSPGQTSSTCISPHFH